MPTPAEERLLRALRVAQVGSWEFDLRNDTLSWTDELYDIYGVLRGSPVSYALWHSLIHPLDVDMVDACVNASMTSGEPFDFEHRLVRPDGEVRVMHSRGEMLLDASGATVGMVGTGQDVTDSRRREEELAEAQRQLLDAQRLAKIGSWRYDVKTQQSSWSRELYHLYGLDPDTFELTLDTFLDMLDPADAEAVRRLTARAATTGEGWTDDVHIHTVNGESRILSGTAEVDLDADGRPALIRGTRQDVTELRQHETRLREAEERFRLAFEEAPIGMALVSPDGRWLRVNRALCRIVGYTTEELLNGAFQDITHPDDLDADLEAVAGVLAGETSSYEMEKRYIHADGDPVWVQLNVSLVRDSGGDPVHFISQIQDITARKATEERLRDSEERAQIASQQKSQFLANMSHEIRTPMNGVMGMAELLADSPLNAVQRQHVDAIRAAANSLLALLNDILDLSKIEAGKVSIEPHDCHLPGLVAETTALFGVAAQTKGIELRSDIAASVPVWVSLDSSRVRQILGNLVGNALKFTQRGNVSLGVDLVDTMLRFTVRDTGIGIAAEVQDRLMSPFEQGDASTTRRFGGTGLGLAICRELTQLMDGGISFTSTLGSGTTFVVDLPYVAGQPVAQTRAPAPTPNAEPNTAGRVLLAEDTPVNQLVARAMLEKSGWAVQVVENGQDAIDALQDSDFDVVILDCQMPVLDGYSAARAIRNLPDPRCRVPILAMTASALPEDRQRCLDAGMDEYIAKPINRSSLGEALQKVLARNNAA